MLILSSFSFLCVLIVFLDLFCFSMLLFWGDYALSFYLKRKEICQNWGGMQSQGHGFQVPWSPLPSLPLQLPGAPVSRRSPVRAARSRQVPQRHRGLSKCHWVLVVGHLSSAWKGEELFPTLKKYIYMRTLQQLLHCVSKQPLLSIYESPRDLPTSPDVSLSSLAFP